MSTPGKKIDFATIPVPMMPGTGTSIPEHRTDLAAVSLATRLPEFWTDQPRLWFIQMEAILNPQKMGDQAKYDIVIGKLNKDAIAQITDLVIQPPTSGKYEALKERLLSIYEESATRQLQKLLSEMELGEQKPSQLLRRMKELARGKIPDHTLRLLWQNHLPPAIRAVLAVVDNKSLDSLATTADTVMDATRPMQIAEVTAPTTSEQSTSTLILAEIAKLSTRLDSMEVRQGRQVSSGYRQRSRSTSRNRNFRRPRSISNRRTPESPDWLCSYHFRYRERARRCEQPCSWNKKTENKQSEN